MMRKALLICAAVLAAIFVVLSLLGRGGEYGAEKTLHRALEKMRSIEENPDVVPPKIVASVENDLKKVLDDFPEGGSARIAYPKLAELYLKSGKYDQAIALSDEVIEKKPDNIALVSKAYFTKAFSYERKGQWDKALAELEILKDKYINTPLGLQVPFYIANYYLRAGEPDKAERSFGEAIEFYQRLMSSYAGTTLGYAASDMLVQVYIYTGKFDEAGKTVEGIISDYPSGVALVRQVPYIELIFVKMLKRPGKAAELFRKMEKETDDDRIKQYLEAAIKRTETIQ
ncbi:MAG: tetratricopeptide repeat protein [Candidatus Omnitrophota bacterium]